MPLIPCPHCRKGVQVAAGSSGQVARCPGCSQQFRLQIPGGEPRRTSRSDYLPMLFGLGLAALLVVGVLGVIGLWAMGWQKKAAPGAAINAAPPDTPIARKAQPGPLSWIPADPLKAADKATWKVTAEPSAPPPGLLSLLPLVHSSRAGFVFSGPAAARAGVLQPVLNPATSRDDLIWTLYDLRQPLPIASITTFTDWQTNRNSDLPVAAMSPSGKQVAIARNLSPSEVQVWSDEGKQVCSITPANIEQSTRNRRLLFAGESRLAVDGGGHLIVYELPAGKELFRLPAPNDTVPVVSRGGNWLAQVTPKSILWFSATDGTAAGTIDFGPVWKAPIERIQLGRITPGLALHPNGRSAAVLVWNSQGEMLLALWDLASGAPIEQVYVPGEFLEGSFWSSISWCGERKLLFNSGQVFDLDLKTWICKYEEGEHLNDVPDGRVWQLASLTEEQVATAAQELNIPKPSTDRALVAAKLPDERIAKRLADARQGCLFYPGYRFAVDADETVPPEYRQEVLGGLADALAVGGFEVDPAAPVRARVTSVSLNRIALGGIKLRSALASIEFTDAQGRDFLPSQRIGADAEGRLDSIWLALSRQMSKVQLPRFVVRDASDKNLEIWGDVLKPGVDGLFAPGEVNMRSLDYQ